MSHRIAVIPGDGVGKEVIPEGIKVLSALGLPLEFEELPWGCEHYERTGRMMPDDALATLARFDAIYLGAIGWPTVPDHVSLWGCLLPIRKTFDQYVNLRPVRLPPGIRSPLAGRGSADVDMLFIRENTEGEYSGAGGRVHQGTPAEVAVEVPVFTRRAIERCARYAFERARERRRRLVSVTKSTPAGTPTSSGTRWSPASPLPIPRWRWSGCTWTPWRPGWSCGPTPSTWWSAPTCSPTS